MSVFRYISALASTSLLLLGCQDPQSDDLEISPYRSQVKIDNGFLLNGFLLNGFLLNGFLLNGFLLNGFLLNGFLLNGPVLNGFLLNGFLLNGTNLDAKNFNLKDGTLTVTMPGSGKVLSGRDLKGLTAKLTIPGANNTTTSVTFRFDDVYLAPDIKTKDVWLYQVSYQNEGSSTWQSMCKDYSGNPSPFTPVMGARWDGATGARIDDPKAFTPACVEGAIGKCITIGYRLWATANSCDGNGKSKKCTDVSLKDYHQACTRMLRADYCGDGTPHTENGTALDVYDYLSPPVQLQEEKWKIEARWKTDGALCISQRRHPEISFTGCMRVTDKKKPASLVMPPTCQPYATGDDRGLIVSTYNGNQ